MAAIVKQEWLNANAGRAYPFEENMARIPYDVTGAAMPALALPNYIVTDMVLTMPGDAGMRVYLSQAALGGDLLTLVFREVAGDAVVAVATADVKTHTTNAAYLVAGSGDFADVRGWVNIGDLSRLAADYPDGIYNFTAAQTLLEARVTRPALRGVRSLRIQNGSNVSEPIYGHVKLIAGANIRLSYDPAINGIWIHAEENAGYTEPCPCADAAAGSGGALSTINGIRLNNIEIVGDSECVEITLEGNRLKIKDTCATPCCGCPELEYLTNTLKIMDSSLNTLSNYASGLSARMNTFITNFVLTVTP